MSTGPQPTAKPSTRFAIAYRLREFVTHQLPSSPATRLATLRDTPCGDGVGSRLEHAVVIANAEAAVRNEVPPADELAACLAILAENSAVVEEARRVIAAGDNDYARLAALHAWAWLAVRDNPTTPADFVRWVELKVPTTCVWEEVFEKQGQGADVPTKDGQQLACELIDAAATLGIRARKVIRPANVISYNEARAIGDQLIQVAVRITSPQSFYEALAQVEAVRDRVRLLKTSPDEPAGKAASRRKPHGQSKVGRPAKYDAAADAKTLSDYEASGRNSVKAFSNDTGRNLSEVEKALKRARKRKKTSPH